MTFHKLLLTLLLLTATVTGTEVDDLRQESLQGLAYRSTKAPYSKAIESMTLGFDTHGIAVVGMAQREIQTYKTITGVILVRRTESGFLIEKAAFPDIHKIKKAKDRRQVESILRMFQNQPFDPYAEKSAVDGLTGATKYGLRVSGYFNYMARKTALEMDTPSSWTQKAIVPE
jgi:hypothetical protein